MVTFSGRKSLRSPIEKLVAKAELKAMHTVTFSLSGTWPEVLRLRTKSGGKKLVVVMYVHIETEYNYSGNNSLVKEARICTAYTCNVSMNSTFS